jgi:hypothetical protein
MSAALSAYDGVCLLGELERKQLGVFPDRRSAMRTVSEAARAATSSQVREVQ